MLLLKYIQDRESSLGKESVINIESKFTRDLLLTKYLQQLNIPIRIFPQGETFNTFYDLEKEFKEMEILIGYVPYVYQPEGTDNAWKLLSDPAFKADLQTLKYKKGVAFTSLGISANQAKNLIRTIEKYDPKIELRYEQLFIIGSGTELGSWSEDIAMNQMDEEGLIWEVEQNLKDGTVKFRTDDLWTYNWGIGHTKDNRLIFEGKNIQVKKGKYIVRVNLKTNKFEFTPIEK